MILQYFLCDFPFQKRSQMETNASVCMWVFIIALQVLHWYDHDKPNQY